MTLSVFMLKLMKRAYMRVKFKSKTKGNYIFGIYQNINVS